MSNRITYIINGILLIFLSPQLFSQSVKAYAKFDTSSIKIGQQIGFSLWLDVDTQTGETINVLWPEFKDTLRKEIEIIQTFPIDTSVPDPSNINMLRYKRQYIITSFDSGYYPVLPIKFHKANDTSVAIAETEAMLLEVHTVETDTSQSIKDIRGIIEVTFHFSEALNYVGWIIAGIVCAIIVFLLYKKYRKNKTVAVSEIVEETPPHDIALNALLKLKEQKLWQQGLIKQYHITLTDIVRSYIEKRYKVQALEQTSEETIISMRYIDINEELKQSLKKILIMADLVKFAKEHPLPNENELAMELAINFIKKTIPVNANLNGK